MALTSLRLNVLNSSCPAHNLNVVSFSSSGRRCHMASTKPVAACIKAEVAGARKPLLTSPPAVHQVTYTMAPEKREIFTSLNDWAEKNILIHLNDVEKNWHPTDFLPDPASEGFIQEVEELRERSKDVPDDYYVVLVGDMITEEAIPTYQSMLNSLDGTRDETGASLTSWAIWTRGWTAEENRHGDLLNKYLYLSGRVDMKQVDKTIQYLIGSGMYIQTENNPYLCFIYTSFQERATFLSHANTARLATKFGDTKLAKICATIAADEKRHEIAYTKIISKLFEIDPDTTMLALADMMRKRITMPAHLLYDGRDQNLFHHFSCVAQRLGVYTAKDYADIVEHLVKKWNVEKLGDGLSSEGRKAQDYVCGLAPRFRKLEERAHQHQKANQDSSSTHHVPFSWVFDKQIKI